MGLIAISGVSVAGNIITIYQAIFIALGAAISSVISKNLGQKDQSMLAYHVTEAFEDYLTIKFPFRIFVHLRWERDDRTFGDGERCS